MGERESTLKNLNELGRGIHKHWIYGDKYKYELAHDFLQKLNYCIQDFNREYNNFDNIKTICYLILLVTWIQESVQEIESIILKEAINGFIYHNNDEILKANDYLKALRSFVVAHPLKTDRHTKYGLDGNYICVDISFPKKNKVMRLFQSPLNQHELSISGLKQVDSIIDKDYCLSVYSKRNGAEFFEYFGCEVDDLKKVAELYIQKIYCLDKYLSKLKKIDFQ